MPVGQCLQTYSLDSQRSKEKGGSCYRGLHLNEERKKVGRNKRSVSGMDCKLDISIAHRRRKVDRIITKCICAAPSNELLGDSIQSNPNSHGSFCIESKTIAPASKSADGSSSAA